MRFSRAVLAAVCAAGVMSGCSRSDEGRDEPAPGPKPNGIADMDPAAAVREAIGANLALEDVTYGGRMSMRFPSGDRVMSAAIATSTRYCSIELSSRDDGKIVMRQVREHFYLKSDDEALVDLFEVPPSSVNLFHGRWTHSQDPPGEAYYGCSRTGVLRYGLDIDACRRGGDGAVRGVPTAVFRCPGPEKAHQRVHVAAVGAPVILRMRGFSFAGPFDLRLVARNTGVEVASPPNRDIIDTGAFE